MLRRVTTAGDAAEAESKLASITFDLLVLDVMLPGLTGIELTKKLRMSNHVPILLLTARGDPQDRFGERRQVQARVLHEDAPGRIEGRGADRQPQARFGQALLDAAEDEARHRELVRRGDPSLRGQQQGEGEPEAPEDEGACSREKCAEGLAAEPGPGGHQQFPLRASSPAAGRGRAYRG